MMLLLFRLELFLYLVYVPTISFMITPKVVYFLHQSLAVGNILIVEVLRSNCGYHSVENYGGLASQSYEFIACECLNNDCLTTGGLFSGQNVKFNNMKGDANRYIGSPSPTSLLS